MLFFIEHNNSIRNENFKHKQDKNRIKSIFLNTTFQSQNLALATA